MVGFITDVGNVRSINEDYLEIYEDDEKLLYVVADGMGGHNAGEVASKLATDTIISYIKERKVESPEELLKNAIKAANERVYNYSLSSNNLNGMGTTITACLIIKDKVFIGNVGDSGCFILKENNIKKITKDHSLVQELLDEGSITEEEAKNHPNKNIITRAIGTKEEVLTDIYKLEKNDFQHILLCTDGFTNEVSSSEIVDLVNSSENYKDFCIKAIELVKTRGARDNISLIIVGGE
ncbi:Stp1/IreP family PP2C-type Ser/Thr phosphatase [Clostridium hydrogeniformans]|uniref:Stp1/IreP family PP2C-type Ser/Thr phosphatase n=1 Tax=Clostridium hydrogeniformans TaxID=349933 RepID=UPI00048A395F|nr:Stp1/IreP family PP2C-type Ser/Thr phosphatase [Clostridium hydrogeniformans]